MERSKVLRTVRAALGVALVATLVLGVTGCRRRGAVVAGGLDARQHQQLLRYAARATGCNEAMLSPSLISAPPSVYTVTGCTTPVEYWQECSRRRCRWHDIGLLNEVAAVVLQCPPQMIQQQPSPAPQTRYAVGCGRIASFNMGCTGRTCAWAQSGPVQAAGGNTAVAQAPPPQGQQQVVVQPGPSTNQAPAANLEVQVQQSREAVLSCIDETTSLTLRFRWTAQGQVMVQLPPELAGTAAEGCIQAALGTLSVSAQQAGEIAVPLR